MTQDDVIRTSPPICALDFGVPAEFAERAESYARWAVAQEREKRTGTQEFVTLPREVVKGALELWKNGCGIALGQLLESILEQPQAEQPAMTPIAQRKLEDLMASGYTISGYSVYHEQKHQHGFVTGAGLVGWWKPEGMEYPQPQGGQAPVAFCNVGDVIVCDNDSILRQLGVKRSDKLYLHPQDLNCKSKQALLATLWGYTKEQPKRPPLTDEEIDKLDWGPRPDEPMTFKEGLRDFARAIEATHNIK